jgi:multidrug efflux pump subunit AcrA (membrane-fusion protein)
VTRIADALDPATRTLMTEIDVPNPEGELSPGTYCTVELKIPRRTPSLIVPAGAIVFDRDGLHVLVIENGIAHSRKITEVHDLGTEVEVSEGIKQGDNVGPHSARRPRGRRQSTDSRDLDGQTVIEPSRGPLLG